MTWPCHRRRARWRLGVTRARQMRACEGAVYGEGTMLQRSKERGRAAGYRLNKKERRQPPSLVGRDGRLPTRGTGDLQTMGSCRGS